MSDAFWIDSIDWQATGIWMQAWAGFAGAGAVAFAAHLGRKTYESWLAQKQAERKMQVGEEVLRVCHEARDQFRSIRNPGSLGFEHAEAEVEIDRHADELNIRDEGHKQRLVMARVIENRLTKSSDLFSSYFEALPLVRIFFGTEAGEEFQKIWRTRADIVVALHMYSANQRNPDRDADRIQRYEDTFFGLEDDPIDSRLRDLIEYFQAIVSPLLVGEEQPAARRRQNAPM